MPKADSLASRLKLPSHPQLYEINAWAWLEGLSRRAGKMLTLGQVPDTEWDALGNLGFDLIWLMGIWKRSPAGRRILRTDPSCWPAYDAALPGWSLDDVVGSPYSIQDYTPDPRFGSWNDIDSVCDQLRARNMRLILDFVPNHTAPDHPWVAEHPEYYIQGVLRDFRKNPAAFFIAESGGSTCLVARGKDPYFPPWPDTAQLNYYNPATREAMLAVLRHVAGHCDGARCDMAMLSLNDVFARTWGPLLAGFAPPSSEFWPAAIAAVPGFIFIGEVYWDMERRMQQLGFHFTYDKQLYDRLLSGTAREIRSYLKADLGYQGRLVRFLENHDEARSAFAFGRERLPALATLLATLPGMRFYHQGQLEGSKVHLPIQLCRAADEPCDLQIQALYKKLLAISREEIFHQGEWQLLEVEPAGDPSFDSLVAFQWRSGETLRVVIANLSAALAEGNVRLDGHVSARAHYRCFDLLNDRNYEWAGQDLAESGLFVRLEAWRSHIFDISAEA
jgi:hypothetical protein